MLYRIRRPWWQRLWMKLDKEQQTKVTSFYYSLAVNCSILVILALAYVAVPGNQAITLTLNPSFGHDEVEDAITIEPVAEEQEEEPEPVEEEPADPEPAPPEEPSEPPPEANGEGEPANSERAAATPSELSELSSDEQRISEIERRVAAAGGGLEGPIRVSLGFSGDDDIDLHLLYQGQAGRGSSTFPIRGHVWYRFRRCRWGLLDVDANARGIARHPAENIFFRSAPTRAKYTVKIDHYKQRGKAEPTPYVVVVKYGRIKKVFTGNIMPGQRYLEVCQFSYRH